MADEYDSPWKAAIERYFADFLNFYFPVAHAKIDWSQPITFLEQELREVVVDAELGKRFVDKLVRVTGQGGQQEWLYIHLEVQGSAQANFAERMFVYNYRLYDRYHTPIASLAVLADDQLHWRPTTFGYEVLDCQMGIRFPVAKLLDWSGQEAKLEDSSNPFAIVTRAHLATRATAEDPERRVWAKWEIVKDLYRHDWDKQQVVELFAVIDWMMRLPKDQDQAFWKMVEATEEEKKMRYVTSIEQLGLERGMEQGMQQGLQRGLQKGQAKMLASLLSHRFGELPPWAHAKLDSGSDEQLETWSKALLSAETVADVFSAGQH